ncbi:hypothetical protein VOLCADRAFT_89713 [Volvox carteri f. nagariensis]|uniref:Pantoate--beta-alanine ligase n=1 Tax=Volvox carteri f. nagariensis TaxID=3068 RepID=D8TSF9_VOLCA|nr:uncharacterized protein VOLCADRAFT_89713 [Volvox carteri f. nagariensis]EFJ49482.1 hypothetical protein VOLCADRAFT_89713 [Volvox carteri f. nagariensis]|eukprot:XP_002949463.1 hypothetical protein VOLCADRAFT_89713 [Volvox carteri f. nagariensis]
MSTEDQELPVFTTAADMRAWVRKQKKSGRKVALVPTMGYLHEGHLSLVKAAKEKADVVVASIYVNPTQFAAHEDFDVYPRNPAEDRDKLAAAGCHAVFEPDSLYVSVPGADGESSNVVGRESGHPGSHETFVTVERLQRPLCGGSRPHFFRGVCTVVTKLFHICEPDVAVFGRKDYQQWRVICRMVRDLDFPVEVVGMPICREPDGLAMSSRNARLSPESRERALCISRGLAWAEKAVAEGAVSEPADVAAQLRGRIEEAGGTVDYVELLHAHHLSPISDLTSQPVLLAVAAHFPARDRGTTHAANGHGSKNSQSV